MESFFDQPRNAPEPTSLDNFTFTPMVPEVSLISNRKTSPDNLCTENLWEIECQQMERLNINDSLPLGYRNMQAHFTKKQVRFESPVLQQKPSCTSNSNQNYCRPKLSNLSTMRREQLSVFPSNGPIPFEQIYMANIPDRKLDLSLIDFPHIGDKINTQAEREIDELSDKSDKSEDLQSIKISEMPLDKCEEKQSENKENSFPKSYQDFLELQKKKTLQRKQEHNDSITDIFNYKRNNLLKDQNSNIKHPLHSLENVLSDKQQTTNNFLESRYREHNSGSQRVPNYQQYEPPNITLATEKFNSKNRMNLETSTDTNTLKALQPTKDHEPSTTDLLKIIAQQNEQLLLLQRQMAILLERDRNYYKPIEGSTEAEIANCEAKKYNSSSTPRKNHFRQENTITKQASIFQDSQRKWGMSKLSINLTTSFDMPMRQQKQNFINQEPKIQEITESDFSPKKDTLENSIHFQEPLAVREVCQSPQPSINIKMNDYESSDDEEPVSDIGATFYNNLMGQVNNMLKKAKTDGEDGPEEDNKKSKMLNKVKEATLKHLKSIGITLGNIDENIEVSDQMNKNYSPSEISCSVKQLLKKYLPPEQRGSLEKPVVVDQEGSPGIISPRPEFSVASLEYMRKYNLIPSKEKIPDFIKPQQDKVQDWNRDNKRILDLTALKMQPKLL